MFFSVHFKGKLVQIQVYIYCYIVTNFKSTGTVDKDPNLVQKIKC